MDTDKLLSDLTGEEEFRSVLYDDVTGRPITQGTTLRGQPTIGIGWNVAGRPCTLELAQIICRYHISQTWAELTKAAPWIASLPEPQARGLTDMAFNMGVPKLLGFGTFLSLMQLGHYGQASDDLAETLWAKQVGSRAQKIQVLIRGQAAS